MNNARRKQIEGIRAEMESASTRLEDIMAEEQDYLDNMPESLQGGEKGATAEEAIDNLQSAIDSLDETTAALMEAQS